jgi:hypothetical protein
MHNRTLKNGVQGAHLSDDDAYNDELHANARASVPQAQIIRPLEAG